MEIRIETVVKNPSSVSVLEYAKSLRQLVGPKAYLNFLRGEKVTHKTTEQESVVVSTYQLDQPAKDVLREEEKKEKPPQVSQVRLPD